MINITLKNGDIRSIEENITVLDFAKVLSRSLAKVALAAKVNDKIVGLDYVLSVTEFVNHNDHATFLP